MTTTAEYRTEHVATAPQGGRVVSIPSRSGSHQLRIWYPSGRRTKGSGKLLEILHPHDENPSCAVSAAASLQNPSELVIFGLANPGPTSGSKSEGAWQRFVDKLERMPKPIRDVIDPPLPGQPRRARGKNPQLDVSTDTRQAVELYSEFQGRDAREIVQLQESAEMRMDYTALGDLEYLVTVMDFDDEEFEEFNESLVEAAGNIDNADVPEESHILEFTPGDGVKLASSPNGGQLYCIGGNQDIGDFLDEYTDDPAGKDFIDLGYCLAVSYIAQKAQNNYKSAGYYHILGEETMDPPRLFYDKLKRRIFFTGGDYRVEAPGIIN